MIWRRILSALQLEFVDNEITAWGGLAILKNLMDQSGFQEKLSSLPLPAQGSNRGHSPVQLITQFMASLWCGANRYSHLDVSRFDTTIQKLFDWERMPNTKHSNDTLGNSPRIVPMMKFSESSTDGFSLISHLTISHST